MPEENKPPESPIAGSVGGSTPVVVSPNGQPYLPPSVARYAIPVVAIAGSVAAAAVMGVDVSFLPPVAIKVCAFIALCVGPALGIASQGARK